MPQGHSELIHAWLNLWSGINWGCHYMPHQYHVFMWTCISHQSQTVIMSCCIRWQFQVSILSVHVVMRTLMMGCSNINTLGPGWNGQLYADAIFKCIFMNDHCFILMKRSVEFVLKGLIEIKLSLIQVMAWHHIGAKLLHQNHDDLVQWHMHYQTWMSWYNELWIYQLMFINTCSNQVT